MRGIVLAAGDGGRLRPLSDTRPKVLLPMLGKPLIAYSVDSLAWAGITEIGVVVGYRAPQLEEALPTIAPAGIQLTVIHNPDFEGGNALSVKAAAEFVGDDYFVLCMGDHVIDRTFVSRVTGGDESEVVLAVDSEASLDSQLNDATRVQVDPDGRLIRIGKGLRQWNAVDTGVFAALSSCSIARYIATAIAAIFPPDILPPDAATTVAGGSCVVAIIGCTLTCCASSVTPIFAVTSSVSTSSTTSSPGKSFRKANNISMKITRVRNTRPMPTAAR